MIIKSNLSIGQKVPIRENVFGDGSLQDFNKYLSFGNIT